MEKHLNNRLNILSAYMGSDLTIEQKEFASNFTESTVSFSDPGTGKTHSTIAGIVLAQTEHGIPGSRIYCMSFTKAATAEIKSRYDKLCKRVGIAPTANFSTFHSLSRVIMAEAYPSMNIIGGYPLKEAIPEFARLMTNTGIDSGDYNYVRRVFDAMNSLNSALVFDEHNLQESYKFRALGIEAEHFQELRKKWFLNRLTRGLIAQGDIPLYCLFALMKFPNITENWKGKYKVMVVDEFQDLSLLHLKILSFIAEELIVIGDVKQQIYGFNGACPQIIDEYMRMYKDARVCPLSKSFRCKDAIVDFATRVIKPNNMSFTEFKGVGPGGSVNLYSRQELDWSDIIGNIKKEIDLKGIYNIRNTLFLYRNNASATPIIEELYANGIPFRCTKFKKIMDLPIFSDLCKMADLANEPTDTEKAYEVLKMCPEYRRTSLGSELTPVQIMKMTGKSIFEIPYNWDNQETKEVIYAIRRAQLAIEADKSASIVLNHCLKAYDEFIIHGEWWRFDMDKEFYMNLIAPITVNKTYPMMVAEEWDKEMKNNESIMADIGIRCYTMHASKGLEADDVYILDADEGVFPNAKEIKRMIDAGCAYEAACRIRDERNLLFVAITRAKDNLVISYSGTPTELLTMPEETKYSWLDNVYSSHENKYDDAKRFFELFNLN